MAPALASSIPAFRDQCENPVHRTRRPLFLFDQNGRIVFANQAADDVL